MRLSTRYLAVLAAMLLLASPPSRSQDPQQQSVDGPLPPAPPKALTNDAIVKMSHAGLGDDLILQTIDSQPGHYATDPDSLLALKSAGVSERVLTRMVRKAASPETAPKPIALPEVTEEGVYYKDKDGHWQPLSLERLRYQSGGWVKSTVTHGIVKQDRNGHVDGRTSKLALTSPLELLVYAPPGIVAEDYEVLHLRVNSSGREFREETGGVFHKSSGAQRDDVPYLATKIGPQSFRIVLTEEPRQGEFGVLPPGVIGQRSATGASRIYTFRMVE